MKELVVLSCSTGFTAYNGHLNTGQSYIERLTTEFNCTGRWINGMTILHVFRDLKQYVRGNKRTVLIHVGAVEAFSHPAPDFLHWYCHELLFNKGAKDPFFMSLVAPKAYQASRDIAHGDYSKYYQILSTDEFLKMWMLVGRLLEGSKAIVVGMTRPAVLPERIHMVQQALDYDVQIKKACSEYNLTHINLWGVVDHCVEDSNHLNETGHGIAYNKIRPLLED